MRTLTAVLLLAAPAVAAAACGSPTPPTSITVSTPAPTSAAPTTTTPGGGDESPAPPATAGPAARSAADDLASFFTEARLADGRIRAAAALVNADFGTAQVVQFRESTVEAARATRPTAVAQAIPAGLPDDLLRSVLLVYSDLVSRSAALNHVGVETDRASLLACLGNGQAPAARFADDLAATQALAETSPAIHRAPPESRTTAELALRIQHIDLANNGCAGCGGQVFTELQPITWQQGTPQAPDVPATDGTIGGIEFWAHYRASDGWDVTIAAC